MLKCVLQAIQKIMKITSESHEALHIRTNNFIIGERLHQG